MPRERFYDPSNPDNFGRYHHSDLQPVISKKRAIPRWMLDPHYTDNRNFPGGRPQTIFRGTDEVVPGYAGMDTVEWAFYNYSDRLSQEYGYDVVQKAYEEASAEEGIVKDSAEHYEAMLRRVYNDPTVELVHILAGYSTMTGYSYKIYGTVSYQKQGDQ